MGGFFLGVFFGRGQGGGGCLHSVVTLGGNVRSIDSTEWNT